MTQTNQLVVSKRNIVLVALTAFGGMITAMLATLAITIPVMSAQAESQLDRQAKQFAQVISTQAQVGTAKQAAGFDITTGEPCVEPQQEGGKGAAHEPLKVTEPKPAVPAKPVQHAKAAPAKPVHKEIVKKKEAPAKHVPQQQVVRNVKNVENKVVNTTNNTYNDNSVHAVNSFNKVEVEAKGKKNDVDVNIGSKNSEVNKVEQTQVNVNKDAEKPVKHDTKEQPEPKADHSQGEASEADSEDKDAS